MVRQIKDQIRIVVVLALWAAVLPACSTETSTTPSGQDTTHSDLDLINFLANENDGIRFSAVRLLGERKAVIAVEPLLEILKHDKEMAIRQAAALAIFSIGDHSVLPILRERSKKDKNVAVRNILAGIVREMEKKPPAAE